MEVYAWTGHCEVNRTCTTKGLNQHSYDAAERLKCTREDNNNVITNYSYDRTDNRTNVNATSSLARGNSNDHLHLRRDQSATAIGVHTTLKAVTPAMPMTPTATALAAPTITYSYDSLGRLVKVVRKGEGVNNVTATYCYDTTGNRTRVKVTSPDARYSYDALGPLVGRVFATPTAPPSKRNTTRINLYGYDEYGIPGLCQCYPHGTIFPHNDVTVWWKNCTH